VRGLGATACEGGGGRRCAQNRLNAPVSATKYTGSSAVWPPVLGHSVYTDGGAEPVYIAGKEGRCTVWGGMCHLFSFCCDCCRVGAF